MCATTIAYAICTNCVYKNGQLYWILLFPLEVINIWCVYLRLVAIVRKKWKYIRNQLGKSGLWETGKCFKLWPNRALAGVRSKLFIRATVNAEVQEHEIGSNPSAPVYHMRYPTSLNRNVCIPVDSGNGLGMKADGTRLKKRTIWTSAYWKKQGYI